MPKIQLDDQMRKHLSDDPHFTNYQSEKPPVYKPKDLIILGLIIHRLTFIGFCSFVT